MIRAINNRFLTVTYDYGNPITQQRATNLLRMNLALLIVTGLLVFIFLLQGISNLQIVPAIVNSRPITVISLGLFITVYLLIQRGRLRIAESLFIFVLTSAIFSQLLITTNLLVYATVPILLIAAGLLLRRRDFFVVPVIIGVGMVIRYFSLLNITTPVRFIPAQTVGNDIILASMIYGIIILFLLAFSGTSERVVASSIKDIRQWNTVSHFSDTLGQIPAESTVFTRVMEVVQNDLGYELAQIYLPDSHETFTRQLRLTFGGAPRRISLIQSDTSVFSEAARTQQPVLVNWREDSFRTEHLIPPSRQSCTIALVESDTVIALLDVQTNRETLFTANEVTAITNLARQASRELEYGISIRDLQNTVREQEAVINRFTRQLSEIQGTGREASASGWGRFFEGRASESFGFDLANENGKLTPINATEIPDAIRDTIMGGQVHIERSERDQVVTVPILFRELVLGAISFNVPPERPITDRQVELIRTVADRLSVALENNRLLEQTQAQAKRERQANEIGSVLLSATNVEAVLNLAAENFNEALGAVHTRVYLQPGALIKSGEAT